MADLRFGTKSVGFSIKAFMAMAFTATACVGFIMKLLTTEAFMTLAGVVVNGYFMKRNDNGAS